MSEHEIEVFCADKWHKMTDVRDVIHTTGFSCLKLRKSLMWMRCTNLERNSEKCSEVEMISGEIEGRRKKMIV